MTTMSNSAAEKRESRRSQVRVWVTYGAAAFLFVGGPILIGILLCRSSYDEAKELFLTILPVSAAVISFWFAGRSPRSPHQDPRSTNQHQASTHGGEGAKG